MAFRFPAIDAFLLLLGIILASLFWWIISLLRPAIQNMRETYQARRNEKQKKEKVQTSSLVEEHYRRTVLRQAQGLHLAAPLFSLDEIIEPPSLLAPPPRVNPGTPPPSEDIVATTVPYLPTWPELGAIYHSPTLTLAQALSGNSDIVLTGHAGMGKTVALAHLASRLARRDPEPGLPQNIVPFLIHIADLDLQFKKDEPLTSLIDLIAEKAAVLDLPRIPDFVRKTFSEGRALVLLDGTDELTPDGLKKAVEFIKAVKRGFPKTRMVTTASNDNLDGLVSLNFIPFSLAAWNKKQRYDFCARWGTVWRRFVSVEAWAQTNEQVDPLLLDGWINSESINLSPLELTLMTWAVYAGDLAGPGPIGYLETHLRRLSPSNIPREALEMLALQINLSSEPIFDPNKAREWIKSFEPPELANGPEQAPENNNSKPGKPDLSQAPSHGLISRMVESGLIIQHRNNRMRFVHPIFGGYLAGKALANYKPEVLLTQPPWIGKYLAMQYLASFGDASPLVEKLLDQVDRPLSRNLMTPAHWLRDAPRQAAWRGEVMAKLVELLKHTGQPMALRGQAVVAFILSGDPSVAPLFRSLFDEQDSELVQLAVLGSGAMQDEKAIEPMAGLINTQISNVRSAACLALVAIGTTPAMDIVGSALLRGDEYLRRAAAEALANHPGEGYAMLREGVTMKDDLLVRRSVAFGLGRIPEPWAEEIVNRMQILDDQWAVRNAALEVTENHQRLNPYIPQRLPQPVESPWLIAFAKKQGLDISRDKLPVDLLLLALKTGTEEERLAALAYLRIIPTDGVFSALYQAMYHGEPYIREVIFQIFSEMAARGVDVPDPVHYGVG
ncbi:MAG TPA: HEAT repeat domain-containing protein [Anaerolineales bacterium]